MLVAFMVGGWVAGRTAGWPARRTGWLNGALVWAVAIPLILMLLTSGVTGILGTAGDVTAQMVPQAQQQMQAQGKESDLAQQAAGQMQEAGEAIRGAASGERPVSESAIDRAQGIAWWTFASFALGLAAAAIGGGLGARSLRSSEKHHLATA